MKILAAIVLTVCITILGVGIVATLWFMCVLARSGKDGAGMAAATLTFTALGLIVIGIEWSLKKLDR